MWLLYPWHIEYSSSIVLLSIEQRMQREGRKGKFMLRNFGKVHSLPHSSGMTNFQLNFIADKPMRSLLTISMVADDLQIVINRSRTQCINA